jgi:Flp pilus assembly protein TadB
MSLTQEQQNKAAKNFSDQVDKTLNSMKKFSKENEEGALHKIDNWTLIAAAVPIVMALVSTYLVFLTKEFLTSLTSIVDFFPPWIVRRAKTDVDFFNKNRKVRVFLENLQASIVRQAIIGDLTREELKEAEEKLQNIDDLIKK